MKQAQIRKVPSSEQTGVECSAMKYAILLAVFAVGCSNPTAPSVTPPVAVTAPTFLHDLRWDLAAPGCTLAKPVPMLNDRLPDMRFDSATSVRALWLMSTSGRRSTYTEGVFRRLGNVWAVCSWDTVIREAQS